ncbi:hypothetical protein NLJ89_g10960 [Agrocybe chaxingu]|uniref:RING-type domain-containing protein n=1 Tax=Agrocybe chaxingu TaxID=84603 RepID=A0A9W8MRL8_9AGAR|nr:hypothetical protein NLJ89_g10960 [Agrocybe chaxingu]
MENHRLRSLSLASIVSTESDNPPTVGELLAEVLRRVPRPPSTQDASETLVTGPEARVNDSAQPTLEQVPTLQSDDGVSNVPEQSYDSASAEAATSRGLNDTFFQSLFSCSICVSVYEQPVVLACGHSFCAPCIRTYMRTVLQDRLDEVSFRFGCVSGLQVPTSKTTVRAIIAALRLYNQDVDEFFHYQCPECRHPIERRPIPVYALRRAVALYERLYCSTSVASGMDAQIHFNGLFPSPRDRLAGLEEELV